MNLNIELLETRQLFDLIVKVQQLVSCLVPFIKITAEELPVWKTMGDVICISSITENSIYNYEIRLNPSMDKETLVFRLINEFLPFYYLDHIHHYKAIVTKGMEQDFDEVDVPLINTAFNADEKPSSITRRHHD